MDTDQKLDKIHGRLDNIDKTLLRNTITLEEHVKRSNMLEAQVKPLQADLEMRKGMMKLAKWLLPILGTILGIAIKIGIMLR